METCKEIINYTFNDTRNWFLEYPGTARLFRRKYTHLIMDLSVVPNTDQVKDEVRKHFLHLQESHNRHDEELKIKAKYKFKEIHLVANNTKKIPMILKPTLYWIFTFVGLSLPFRWFRSILFHTVHYKIQKYVNNIETTPVKHRTIIQVSRSHEINQDFYSHRKSRFSPILFLNHFDKVPKSERFTKPLQECLSSDRGQVHSSESLLTITLCQNRAKRNNNKLYY